jgi:hypothetical protein
MHGNARGKLHPLINVLLPDSICEKDHKQTENFPQNRQYLRRRNFAPYLTAIKRDV